MRVRSNCCWKILFQVGSFLHPRTSQLNCVSPNVLGDARLDGARRVQKLALAVDVLDLHERSVPHRVEDTVGDPGKLGGTHVAYSSSSSTFSYSSAESRFPSPETRRRMIHPSP